MPFNTYDHFSGIVLSSFSKKKKAMVNQKKEREVGKNKKVKQMLFQETVNTNIQTP